MKMRTIGLTSMALAAVAVIAAWNVVSPAPAHAGGVPGSGDADCSGVTDSKDALLILQSEAGLLEGGVPCREAADTNADARIDAHDATFILQFAAGLLATLPPLPQPVFDLVVDAAAEALDVPRDSLAVTAVEATGWGSACLGLAQPGELCASVITYGWIITVEAEGRGGVWHATADSLFPYVRLAYLF